MNSPAYRRPSACRPGLGLLGAALLLAAGCAVHDYWDNLTSRDLTWQERLWHKEPEPLEVLRSSSDGAKKGKALAALRDPGDAESRETYLAILTATVNLPEDPKKYDAFQREPLCVLGAVYALGSYKDPRAVHALNNLHKRNPLGYTSEVNSIVRQHILAALEETGQPQALHTLIAVAKQPSATGSSFERREVNDERLQAIRALRRFKQAEAAEALVQVLDREKDIAVRHRAHESLRSITGKDTAGDAQSWRQVLYNNDPGRQPSLIERAMWWKQ